MNVSVPKLEYAGKVREGNAKFVKQRETAVQMTAAKKILGCSSTASNNAVLRAKLGMYPLKQIETCERVEMTIQSRQYARKEVASHS